MSEQGTSNHYHYKIRNDQIRDQINSKIVSAKATSPILESFHDYQPPRNTHISPASDDDVQACRDILEAENSAHPRPHHQILQNSHVENITKSKTISESQDNHAINAQEGNKVIKRKKVKRKAKKNDRPSNLQSRPFIHESNQGMKAQNDIRQNDSFNLDKKLESIHKVTSLSKEAEIQLKSQNPSTYERNNLKQHDKEKTKQFTSQDKFHRQDPLENSVINEGTIDTDILRLRYQLTDADRRKLLHIVKFHTNDLEVLLRVHENKQRKTHQLSDKRNEFNEQDDKNINSEAQQSAHQKIVLGEAQLEENTHTYNKNIMPEKEYSDYDKSHTERQSDQQNYLNGNEYRQENILNKQTKLQSETSLRQPMLSNDYINQTAPSHETVSQLRQNITNKYGSDTESKQQNLLVTEGRKIYHQSASNVAAGKETMETPRRAAHLDISPESQGHSNNLLR
ncbi:uncharacterized protein TRIADDRAFT_59707 [Trichoplax adhaerens]|uniref:Uncharacterized protein n=1 Tax=Trichoplax adhaerens TaxID=10228 RepID=B3S678_TRIAD|nr:hypothetical protein TRIADDRAFT_59707 [Trichoplax adhaerens]EDV21575.1 hypothetical protein TRIADDRAFT_59707 [Trichoplax adhaerens]|eukprot:XP_002115723.1 hypothetical protein TRIADDRAFT_59707 [Trichoplax adhaerens]